jgi:hypothetical protein
MYIVLIKMDRNKNLAIHSCISVPAVSFSVMGPIAAAKRSKIVDSKTLKVADNQLQVRKNWLS